MSKTTGANFSLTTFIANRNSDRIGKNDSNQDIFNNSESLSDRILECYELEPETGGGNGSRRSQTSSLGGGSRRRRRRNLNGSHRSSARGDFNVTTSYAEMDRVESSQSEEEQDKYGSNRTGLISEVLNESSILNSVRDDISKYAFNTHYEEASAPKRPILHSSSSSKRSLGSSSAMTSKFQQPPPVLVTQANRWGQFDTNDLEAESFRASASAITNAAIVYAQRIALMEEDDESEEEDGVTQESGSLQSGDERSPDLRSGYRSMSLGLQKKSNTLLKRKSGDHIDADPDGETNISYDLERGKLLLKRLEEMSIAQDSNATSLDSRTTTSKRTSTPSMDARYFDCANKTKNNFEVSTITTRTDMMVTARQQISDLTISELDREDNARESSFVPMATITSIGTQFDHTGEEDTVRASNDVLASKILGNSGTSVHERKPETPSKGVDSKENDDNDSLESQSSDIKHTMNLLTKSRLLTKGKVKKSVGSEASQASEHSNRIKSCDLSLENTEDEGSESHKDEYCTANALGLLARRSMFMDGSQSSGIASNAYNAFADNDSNYDSEEIELRLKSSGGDHPEKYGIAEPYNTFADNDDDLDDADLLPYPKRGESDRAEKYGTDELYNAIADNDDGDSDLVSSSKSGGSNHSEKKYDIVEPYNAFAEDNDDDGTCKVSTPRRNAESFVGPLASEFVNSRPSPELDSHTNDANEQDAHNTWGNIHDPNWSRQSRANSESSWGFHTLMSESSQGGSGRFSRNSFANSERSRERSVKHCQVSSSDAQTENAASARHNKTSSVKSREESSVSRNTPHQLYSRAENSTYPEDLDMPRSSSHDSEQDRSEDLKCVDSDKEVPPTDNSGRHSYDSFDVDESENNLRCAERMDGRHSDTSISEGSSNIDGGDTSAIKNRLYNAYTPDDCDEERKDASSEGNDSYNPFESDRNNISPQGKKVFNAFESAYSDESSEDNPKYNAFMAQKSLDDGTDDDKSNEYDTFGDVQLEGVQDVYAKFLDENKVEGLDNDDEDPCDKISLQAETEDIYAAQHDSMREPEDNNSSQGSKNEGAKKGDNAFDRSRFELRRSDKSEDNNSSQGSKNEGAKKGDNAFDRSRFELRRSGKSEDNNSSQGFINKNEKGDNAFDRQRFELRRSDKSEDNNSSQGFINKNEKVGNAFDRSRFELRRSGKSEDNNSTQGFINKNEKGDNAFDRSRFELRRLGRSEDNNSSQGLKKNEGDQKVGNAFSLQRFELRRSGSREHEIDSDSDSNGEQNRRSLKNLKTPYFYRNSVEQFQPFHSLQKHVVRDSSVQRSLLSDCSSQDSSDLSSIEQLTTNDDISPSPSQNATFNLNNVRESDSATSSNWRTMYDALNNNLSIVENTSTPPDSMDRQKSHTNSHVFENNFRLAESMNEVQFLLNRESYRLPLSTIIEESSVVDNDDLDGLATSSGSRNSFSSNQNVGSTNGSVISVHVSSSSVGESSLYDLGGLAASGGCNTSFGSNQKFGSTNSSVVSVPITSSSAGEPSFFPFLQKFAISEISRNVEEKYCKDTAICKGNEQFASLLGRSRKEFVKIAESSICHPEDTDSHYDDDDDDGGFKIAESSICHPEDTDSHYDGDDGGFKITDSSICHPEDTDSHYDDDDDGGFMAWPSQCSDASSGEFDQIDDEKQVVVITIHEDEVLAFEQSEEDSRRYEGNEFRTTKLLEHEEPKRETFAIKNLDSLPEISAKDLDFDLDNVKHNEPKIERAEVGRDSLRSGSLYADRGNGNSDWGDGKEVGSDIRYSCSDGDSSAENERVEETTSNPTCEKNNFERASMNSKNGNDATSIERTEETLPLESVASMDSDSGGSGGEEGGGKEDFLPHAKIALEVFNNESDAPNDLPPSAAYKAETVSDSGSDVSDESNAKYDFLPDARITSNAKEINSESGSDSNDIKASNDEGSDSDCDNDGGDGEQICMPSTHRISKVNDSEIDSTDNSNNDFTGNSDIGPEEFLRDKSIASDDSDSSDGSAADLLSCFKRTQSTALRGTGAELQDNGANCGGQSSHLATRSFHEKIQDSISLNPYETSESNNATKQQQTVPVQRIENLSTSNRNTDQCTESESNIIASETPSTFEKEIDAPVLHHEHAKPAAVPTRRLTLHSSKGIRRNTLLPTEGDLTSQENKTTNAPSSGAISSTNGGGARKTLSKSSGQTPEKSSLFFGEKAEDVNGIKDIETGLNKPPKVEQEPLVGSINERSNLAISTDGDYNIHYGPEVSRCRKYIGILAILATALALAISVLVLVQVEASDPLTATSVDSGTVIDTAGPSVGIKFESKIWTEQASIIPEQYLDDRLGFATAVSADGNRLVVGGKDYSTDSDAKLGIVRIYDLVPENDQGMQAWREIALITGKRSNDQFGAAISLSADGTILVVGAPGHDKDIASDTNEGKVFVFDISANNSTPWEYEISSFDGEEVSGQFGLSVSLESKGNDLAIGAPLSNNAVGKVFVYKKDGRGIWYQVSNVLNGSSQYEQFGASVSIALDGVQLVVGAPGSTPSFPGGYIKVYRHKLQEWAEDKLISSKIIKASFGYSISQSPDANVCLVGAPGVDNERGSAYLFSRLNGIFDGSESEIKGFEEGDRLGWSVSVSLQGNRFIVGLPGRGMSESVQFGSAIVYQIAEDKISLENSKEIYGDEEMEESNFGQSVSLNKNGTVVVVSSPSTGVIRSYI